MMTATANTSPALAPATVLFLFQDVPAELVEVVNMIRFNEISPAQQQGYLLKLQEYADTLVQQGHLHYRKNMQRTQRGGTFRLRAGIPQAALDVLNRYEYQKRSLPVRKLLKSKVLGYLEQIQVPMYR